MFSNLSMFCTLWGGGLAETGLGLLPQCLVLEVCDGAGGFDSTSQVPGETLSQWAWKLLQTNSRLALNCMRGTVLEPCDT